MHIAITGHEGFLGRHLVHALKKKRGITLSFFDRKHHDLYAIDSLRAFVARKDVIIHLATVQRGEALAVIGGNIVMTYNIAEAVRRFKSPAKLIFPSSIQAETETLYGRCKRLAETMLEDLSKAHHIPVSVLRFTNIFGENGKPFCQSVVSTFCHEVSHGQPLTIHDGAHELRLLYQQDAVAAILREVDAKRKKLFYFRRISSPHALTVKKLAVLIQDFKENGGPSRNATKLERNLFRTYASYANAASYFFSSPYYGR